MAKGIILYSTILLNEQHVQQSRPLTEDQKQEKESIRREETKATFNKVLLLWSIALYVLYESMVTLGVSNEWSGLELSKLIIATWAEMN